MFQKDILTALAHGRLLHRYCWTPTGGWDSNRYIVTIMDVYSRYLIATPVRNHKASTVSRCLYESVVAYFGAPRSLLSDRGAKFTSIIWESLTQMLGARIKLTSPYYPQGNAVIERSHRTLSNMLRAMLLERREKDWSSLLPSVMLYMNSMVQRENRSLCL